MQQDVVKYYVGKVKFVPVLPSPSLQSLFLYSALNGDEMSASVLSHSTPEEKSAWYPLNGRFNKKP